MWTRRDSRTATRAGSSDSCEAGSRREHRIKNAVAAMLLTGPCHDHRRVVDLLLKGVMKGVRWLPMQSPVCLLVVLQVGGGRAVVRILSWVFELLLLISLLPRYYGGNWRPSNGLLHRKTNVMRRK